MNSKCCVCVLVLAQWVCTSLFCSFRFVRAHGDEVMTAMALDALQRRLLTGSDKGGMKVWNFSSGACLKEMISLCSKDITGER